MSYLETEDLETFLAEYGLEGKIDAEYVAQVVNDVQAATARGWSFYINSEDRQCADKRYGENVFSVSAGDAVELLRKIQAHEAYRARAA